MRAGRAGIARPPDVKESAELRARYLDYANLDVALSAVAETAAVEEGTGDVLEKDAGAKAHGNVIYVEHL